jgi:putative transposon-encoded protein
MDHHKIKGHEVIDGMVKPTGNGAHVLVPRRWLDADVKVVRTSEPTGEDERSE